MMGTEEARTCKYCGAVLVKKIIHLRTGRKERETPANFHRRKYCGKRCCGLDHRSSIQTKGILCCRARAHLREACEFCGSQKRLSAHHISRDRTDNSPANIQTLCVSCHARLHYPHGVHKQLGRAPCAICGEPSEGHGLCVKHCRRWQKYGSPYLTGVRQSGAHNRYVVVDEREIAA